MSSQCPSCGENESSDTAAVCSRCGSSLQSPTPEEEDAAGFRLFAVWLACIGLFVGFVITGGGYLTITLAISSDSNSEVAKYKVVMWLGVAVMILCAVAIAKLARRR